MKTHLSTYLSRTPKKPALPAQAHNDIMLGELTVSEIFSTGAVTGSPDDYDLTIYTPLQIGNLAKLKEQPANVWAAMSELDHSTPPAMAQGETAAPVSQVYEPPAFTPGIKNPLPAHVLAEIKKADGFTLAQQLEYGLLGGQASDYDLSGLTVEQIGSLPIGQAALIR